MPSFAKTNTLTEAQVVLRAVLIASLAITFPFVFLRCFVRAQVQSRFSIDDYLLVAALVAFAIQQSLSIYAIDYGGFGRKTSELPREVLLKGIKWIVIAQSTYTLALMLAKLSVAFLQLRVIGLSTLMLRRIHYATVVINLVIGLYEFFTLLFQCYPNGDPIVIFGNAHKCTTRRPVVISVYIYSAVNILLDWYYSFAIVPLIWRLQNMRTVVKVSVIVILGMGFFASIATIIRLKYLLGFDDSHDPLLAVVPNALWSSVEQCVGMCAACIATFRPLLRLIPSLVSSRGRSRGSSSACRNGCNDVDGGDARLSMTWKSRLSGRQRRAIGAEGADRLSLEDLEGASVIEGESWSEEEGDGHGLRTSEAVVEYRSEGVFAKATTTLPGHDGQHAFGDLQASVASVATSKDGAEVGTVADDAESQRSILRPKQSVSRPGHS